MNRVIRIALLSFALGGTIGVWDAAVLLWQEEGVRLLNPILETLQVIVAYGTLTAILGVIGAFLFRRWQAGTVAAGAAAGVGFAAAFIWVHSRILVNKPMFGGESMMGNVLLLAGLALGWIALRTIANHRQAGILIAILLLVPAVGPLTRWVKLDETTTATPPADAPNITVLLLDTQRADRLGCYGYQREDGAQVSPVIDGLAEQGALFEWCYAPAPWTRPSVASMFSGLYPTSHGAYEPTRALPGWSVTMAEMLHRKGYRTAGFSANANISAVWGFAQGFEEFWCLDDKELLDMVTFGEATNKLRRIFKLFHETPDNARVVNEQVWPWLNEVSGGDRPAFTYIQYLDPHFPYNPPEDLVNDPKPNYDELVAQVESSPHTYLPFPFEARPKPPQQVLEGFKQLYDAEVAFMDREIGVLVDRLRSSGLLGEDDWLIITSDHGEEFFEHLQWGHGQNLMHEVIRVPLIVVGPGVPAGQVIETPVSLVDLLPTMASWVGGEEIIDEGIRKETDEGEALQPEPTHPGRNLMPLLRPTDVESGDGLSADDIDIYAEKLRRPANLALRRGDFKVVQVEVRKFRDPDDPGEPLQYLSLYDVGQDPYETRAYVPVDMLDYEVHPDVQADFVPLPDGLDEAYVELLDRLGALKTAAQNAGFGVEARPLSPSEMEAMIRLGYITNPGLLEDGAEGEDQ